LNLKESLLDVNFYHNNKIYSNTGFKTVEIKDYMDGNKLNEIKKNSIDSMEKNL
jgi:hypothetical protein